jgi:hypothetical protein
MPLGREKGVLWLEKHLKIPLADVRRLLSQNRGPWSTEKSDIDRRLHIPQSLQDRLASASSIRDAARVHMGWSHPRAVGFQDPSLDTMDTEDWSKVQGE